MSACEFYVVYNTYNSTEFGNKVFVKTYEDAMTLMERLSHSKHITKIDFGIVTKEV